MIQVGRILDIHVMDHLIISERQYCGYYSFNDHRLMDELRKSVKYIPSFEVKQNFEKKLKTIHKAFKEEIKLTKIKSKELGRKQGEKIGVQKEKLEIAKAMIQKGYPIDDIVSLTGLPINQVEQLRQSD